jgi:hypothetical protein
MIARMSPQFATQDDDGNGDGISPVSQWIELANHTHENIVPGIDGLILKPAIDDTLRRLRMLLNQGSTFQLSTADFHDLVCFVLHRLLDARIHDTSDLGACPLSTSRGLSYAMALYLLAIHGPTYFSHDGLQCRITLHLKEYLDDALESLKVTNASLSIWMLSVGMVASLHTPISREFSFQAELAALDLGVYDWDGIRHHLRAILWLENTDIEQTFLQAWQEVWLGTVT